MTNKVLKILNNKKFLKEQELLKLRGKDGIDGVSIKGDKGESGENGKDGRDGKDGRNGKDGRDGKDGISIKGDKGESGVDGLNGVSIINAHVDDRGDLIIKYSDGRIENAGHVRGRDGVSGGGGGGAIRQMRNRNYIIKGEDYSLKKTDYYVELNVSGSTATLYSNASTGQGCNVYNSSDDVCYVTPVNGQTIQLLPDESLGLVYNGTVWRLD